MADERLEQLDPVTREALGLFAQAIEQVKAVQHAQGELLRVADSAFKVLELKIQTLASQHAADRALYTELSGIVRDLVKRGGLAMPPPMAPPGNDPVN